jgi:mRNA interferase RelE/StbE
LPPEVAVAAAEFITGPLFEPAARCFDRNRGRRLGREWRILYEIDENRHVVIILDIRHRSIGYRAR